MQPYMGHMGGGYCPTGQGHDVYQNQPYAKQSFQGTWNLMTKPRIPLLDTLNILGLFKLTNDLVCRDPIWSVVPTKLPSYISNFKGNNGEDTGDHVTTFHLLFSLNSFNHDSIRLVLFQRALMVPAMKRYIDILEGTY